MVAARDASRRSGRSREIISNSQSRGEHTATKIPDGDEWDEHTSTPSRRNRSSGGRRAQESHGKQREWEGVGILCPEDCSSARADRG